MAARRTIEERILEAERREAQAQEKAKQYQNRMKVLKKKQAEEQRRKRARRLTQIGEAVEAVLGREIPESDLEKLTAFLRRQELNGRYFSKAMRREEDTLRGNDVTPVGGKRV